MKNKRVLIIAQYAAPYEGNFIASLRSLADTLMTREGAQVVFTFPDKVESRSWWPDFANKYMTYLIPSPGPGCDEMLGKIVYDYRPDFVHTHFDGYDVPAYNALRALKRKAVIIWHMHDALNFIKHPLKNILIARHFFNHYGKPVIANKLMGGAIKMSCIYVSPHEQRFVRPYRCGLKLDHEKVIPNGIKTDKLLEHLPKPPHHQHFTFLSYGGRNIQKRIDLLMKAGELLYNEGIGDFEIVITDGTDTKDTVRGIYKDEIPKWLKLISQNNDITQILSQADCFVSTSVAETFSFAICEASVYGLPVIQSDIEGTMWNADNPSTFTFRSGDVEELKNRMKEVMCMDKELLLHACTKTREHNAAHYSLKAWTEKVIDFYKHLSF